MGGHELDDRRFAQAATSEDPLTTEKLVAALIAAKIPVYARPRGGGGLSMDNLSTAGEWWDLLVPEAMLAQAATLIEAERSTIEAEAAENAKAAEEEERASESTT